MKKNSDYDQWINKLISTVSDVVIYNDYYDNMKVSESESVEDNRTETTHVLSIYRKMGYNFRFIDCLTVALEYTYFLCGTVFFLSWEI